MLHVNAHADVVRKEDKVEAGRNEAPPLQHASHVRGLVPSADVLALLVRSDVEYGQRQERNRQQEWHNGGAVVVPGGSRVEEGTESRHVHGAPHAPGTDDRFSAEDHECNGTDYDQRHKHHQGDVGSLSVLCHSRSASLFFGEAAVVQVYPEDGHDVCVDHGQHKQRDLPAGELHLSRARLTRFLRVSETSPGRCPREKVRTGRCALWL